MDMDISSGSDDGDAYVADLLDQFANPDKDGPIPFEDSSTHHEETDTRRSSLPESDISVGTEVNFAVEVPVRNDLSDYDFLPGHFSVDEIIRQSGRSPAEQPSYYVQLRSGETETVSMTRLKALGNGIQALNDFGTSGVSRSTRSSRSTNFSTTGSQRRATRRKPSEGFVNWGTLEISSEDEISRPSARNLRPRQISISSGESSRGASSEDETDDSSLPSRKRKARFSEKRSSKRVELMKSRKSEGTRFSERTRTSMRNMRERTEGDIPETDVKTGGTKYSGAKEYFKAVPKDDQFRLLHHLECDTCSLYGDDDEKGSLVFCQGCTNSYHKACLGPRGTREHLVTKVDEGNFVLQCRRCLGVPHLKDPLVPHQGKCVHCKELGAASHPFRTRISTRQEQIQREENGSDSITDVDSSLLNNTENIMFRCATCSQAWHMSHLIPGQSADAAFKEYSRRWTCKNCNESGEIESLVAWRPANLETFIPGYTAEMIQESDLEYLVKWRKRSYFRTTWMSGAWVWGVTAAAMRRAFNKSSKNLKPKMTTEDAIPEEYLRIDIILDVKYSNVVRDRTQQIDMARAKEVDLAYLKFKGLSYEDSVWEEIPPVEDTERWKDYITAYEDWVLSNYVHIPRGSALAKRLSHARAQPFEAYLLKQKQPSLLTGGTIMDYQKDGLNWLYYMWYKKQNAILADEMGLGKTIQVIALFATLIEDHRCFPFLVVVPNSTCPNWRREIKTWAPSLRVVTYYGTSAARKIAHDYEMFPGGTDLRCHIVVTSYETMVDDKARRIFSRIPWAGLVVDEGQRLKSDKNLLYSALSRIKFPFKILLTGTPLQNNVRELFNLLQFCDSSKNAQELEETYATLTNDNVPELHEIIRPFFLRRTKAQVLTFLPPVAQIIVPVTMSVVQKKLYKSILAKNPQLIKAIFRGRGEGQGLKQTERHNLNNLLMQLRKCLCHPFVYSKAIEERSYNAAVSHRNLVEASSKLQLFELMLPKLQERGHRVLIFSQFLDNLDIVEDFLDGLGLLHRRLDGSMNALEKQKRIDEFNAPDSPYFAFLLSTRSGGVGINLASADTVIIMDPDFNPHQDIQALSRAHRIGQKKKVLVFQLMTRGSAEEKIIQIGRKKMALDHVLIDRMDADDETELDLESILRHGAEALFDNDTTDDIQYDSESVEKLLDRTQAENTKTGEDASAESQFSFARIWTKDALQDGDEMGLGEESTAPANGHSSSTVWDKILRERERAAQEEAAAKMQALGRGKRARRAVDYVVENAAGNAIPSPASRKSSRRDESDTDFQAQPHDSDAETDMDSEVDAESFQHVKSSVTKPSAAKSSPTKARPFKRVPHPGSIGTPTVDGGSETTMETQSSICLACNAPHPVGYCPLKLAGVEHCGLCGIAHIGHSRTCPHLNSEAQVAMMLGALKQSTEQRALIDEAARYLRGIRGDLVRRKKVQAAKNAGLNGAPPSATATPIGTSPSTSATARTPHRIPPHNFPRSLPQGQYRNPISSGPNFTSQPPLEGPNNSAPSSAGYSRYARTEGKNT